MAYTSYYAAAVNDAGEQARVFIIDSASDVATLPTDVIPGSMARTADFSLIYSLSNNGTWVEVSL